MNFHEPECTTTVDELKTEVARVFYLKSFWKPRSQGTRHFILTYGVRKHLFYTECLSEERKEKDNGHDSGTIKCVCYQDFFCETVRRLFTVVTEDVSFREFTPKEYLLWCPPFTSQFSGMSEYMSCR